MIIGKGNRLKQCLREVSLLKTGDVFVVISLFPSTWANFIATVKTANVTTSSAVNSRVSPPQHFVPGFRNSHGDLIATSPPNLPTIELSFLGSFALRRECSIFLLVIKFLVHAWNSCNFPRSTLVVKISQET